VSEGEIEGFISGRRLRTKLMREKGQGSSAKTLQGKDNILLDNLIWTGPEIENRTSKEALV